MACYRFFDLREVIVKSEVGGTAVDLISINCEDVIRSWMQMKQNTKYKNTKYTQICNCKLDSNETLENTNTPNAEKL